ncbi:TPA: hypothetical protein NIE10_001813 [Pseudomonas aeruginosa]|nr:hypothetical protein [Pseudomonas aeruginosa]HBO4616644.1 hypothetical protein [Pseudomonas aeruginosa]HCF4136744.1 hypothetical protein [Pseudomonas aeruginosa]
MKARIEKKLSKRLVELYPALYCSAWRDEEPSALAYEQGSRVRHVLSVGGGVDYWGEGQDAYTVWQDWLMSWEWHGPFETYPEGHRHEYLPDTEGFKPTTRNLLQLAGRCQLLEAASTMAVP